MSACLDSAWEKSTPKIKSVKIIKDNYLWGIGYENFKNWIEVGGFDNITFKPNGMAQKKLTKLLITICSAKSCFKGVLTGNFGQSQG